MAASSDTKRRSPIRPPIMLGACIFIAIAAFFLYEEHRAHALGILPYLLLAACPLIHLFMHGGHNGHHARHAQDGGDQP